MMIDGILLIDKGFGLTSFETVQQVRKLTGAKRAGHAGTLDPYATGILVVTLGKATKLSSYLVHNSKRYRAKIKLGQNTETWDRFGRILDERNVDTSINEIERVTGEFRGDFNQQVPPYSAVHVDGRRMYELARRGEDIPPRYRTVQINEIKILGYEKNLLEMEILCGSGTYIRSIAYRLGEKLGCGAHLFSLTRIASGKFIAEDSLTVQQLKAVINMELFDNYLIPLEKALEIPSIIIGEPKASGVRHGQNVVSADISAREGEFSEGELIGIKDQSGRLLAVGTALVSSRGTAGAVPENMKVFEYKRVI
jgi:tRNA pseudouridine55 synthase